MKVQFSILIPNLYSLYPLPRLCFFRLFMRHMLIAPFAKLLQRDFTLHLPDILTRPVIIALASSTLQADKIWLWHILCNTECLTNNSGARSRNRTGDLRITIALLCRLSYPGIYFQNSKWAGGDSNSRFAPSAKPREILHSPGRRAKFPDEAKQLVSALAAQGPKPCACPALKCRGRELNPHALASSSS